MRRTPWGAWAGAAGLHAGIVVLAVALVAPVAVEQPESLVFDVALVAPPAPEPAEASVEQPAQAADEPAAAPEPAETPTFDFEFAPSSPPAGLPPDVLRSFEYGQGPDSVVAPAHVRAALAAIGRCLSTLDRSGPADPSCPDSAVTLASIDGAAELSVLDGLNLPTGLTAAGEAAEIVSNHVRGVVSARASYDPPINEMRAALAPAHDEPTFAPLGPSF